MRGWRTYPARDRPDVWRMLNVMHYLDSRTVPMIHEQPDYWNPILHEDALLKVEAILAALANSRNVVHTGTEPVAANHQTARTD